FFWMKNTTVELAIIYIDRNFNVVSIKRGKPLSEATLPSIFPSRYVLEVNWAEGKKIVPGDSVDIRSK
ncbi:MAG TPA: DUF192 domain-containing protein, partial [bacterium]|nr:DUF192 domain-containing protein [bacterium]